MPTVFATSFGLTAAVYVYDHFDTAGVLIANERFPNSPPVSLADCLCQAICDSPFFMASQFDADFTEVFSINSKIHLTTARIIAEKQGESIFVAEPPMTITEQICEGCPGYCAMFARVRELVQRSRTRADKGAKYRCVADECRNARLLHQLVRFLLLRGNALSEAHINGTALNQLMVIDQARIDTH
jgi:hypothetical protein